MTDFIGPFLKHMDIYVLGYDITNRESFNDIKDFWLPFIKNEIIVNNQKFYLIGNKVDLEKERQVLREEAEKFAIENKFIFFEVSAYYYINIKELLSDFINRCLN